MSITDMPVSGSMLELPKSKSYDNDIRELYRKNNIRPATGVTQIPEWA